MYVKVGGSSSFTSLKTGMRRSSLPCEMSAQIRADLAAGAGEQLTSGGPSSWHRDTADIRRDCHSLPRDQTNVRANSCCVVPQADAASRLPLQSVGN